MRHKGMTFCKLLVLLVLALLLTGCAQQPQAPFDGVIATSDVVFNLDFSALNTTYTSTLIVPEGKEIMADIQCDGGRNMISSSRRPTLISEPCAPCPISPATPCRPA